MPRYQETYITIQRPDGTPLLVGGVAAQHIPVLLQQMSAREAMFHIQMGATRTAALFRVVTSLTGLFPIKSRDVLVDELNIDPDAPAGTTGYYRYRVISNPVEEFDDHQECVCEVVRGG